MEVVVRGDADGGPSVELDHAAFAYAGKFRMTTTGKALALDDGTVLAAIAFNRDRTDPATVWFRYLTVRTDRRGDEIGARLAATLADRVLETAERVRIAVNNPFAYEALYKAGFGFTGEHTGVAELVLERPGDRSAQTYQAGLAAFNERDTLSGEERSFLATRPPEPPTQLAAE